VTEEQPVGGGSALQSVVVVLVEPQDQVNIAATVRAMKNMGVAHLRLVNPASYEAQRLIGIAHDTAEIIESIKHFDSLEAACADCVRVLGFTARRRSARREIVTPRQAAEQFIDHASIGSVAFVFGREDRGLSNEQLDRAHAVVTIPTTNHSSLNLAQAVLVALYEAHLAAADATRKLAPPRKFAPPATSLQYEQLFADCERALEEISFFKTRFRSHVMRTVRSLVYRAAPDAREIDMVRSVAIEVMRTIERVSRSATHKVNEKS
jgi:TrmH family RNA methyltransferase